MSSSKNMNENFDNGMEYPMNANQSELLSFYGYYAKYPKKSIVISLAVYLLIEVIVRMSFEINDLIKFAFIASNVFIAFFCFFSWNHVRNNNKEIISFLKEAHSEKEVHEGSSNLSAFSSNPFISYVTSIIVVEGTVDSFCINYGGLQTVIGTFSLFDGYSRKSGISRKVKGLFAKADIPYDVGNIVISNSQLIKAEENDSSIIKNRFVPRFANIPLTIVNKGDPNRLLNDRMQLIISNFSAKNENIGIVFEKNTVFVALFCKYFSFDEKKPGYYESVSEAVSELLNTLYQIIEEFKNLE